ncbi:FCD domain-containing protein [Yinghuangia aomiensis]
MRVGEPSRRNRRGSRDARARRRTAGAGDDIPSFLRANVRWHNAVARASGNELLIGFMSALSEAIYAATDIEKPGGRGHPQPHCQGPHPHHGRDPQADMPRHPPHAAMSGWFLGGGGRHRHPRPRRPVRPGGAAGVPAAPAYGLIKTARARIQPRLVASRKSTAVGSA